MEKQYWLVGASWGGTEHQDQRFVENGIWVLGWEQGHQPERAKQLRKEDRIAIKRMLGQGKTGLRIIHLGIIRGVISDSEKVICTVAWVTTGVDRIVAESHGCFQSIHGPYLLSDPKYAEWLREIFIL